MLPLVDRRVRFHVGLNASVYVLSCACNAIKSQALLTINVYNFLNIFIAAWIGTLHYASGCVLSPVGSYLTNRFSYRFTAMLGSLAGISGFLLASFSPKLWMLYITYGLLAGFGHITVISSSNLVILPYFVKWRSLGVGVVVSAPAIGTFVMTQLTQSLLNAFDWQWTVRGFSILYLVCGLCSTLFVPLNKQKEESTNNKKRQEEERTSLFRNRSFLILLASLTVVHLSYYVPNVHIVSTKLREAG